MVSSFVRHCVLGIASTHPDFGSSGRQSLHSASRGDIVVKSAPTAIKQHQQVPLPGTVSHLNCTLYPNSSFYKLFARVSPVCLLCRSKRPGCCLPVHGACHCCYTPTSPILRVHHCPEKSSPPTSKQPTFYL